MRQLKHKGGSLKKNLHNSKIIIPLSVVDNLF